jgi:N-acetylneuraminic acid mutarotase
VALEAAPTAVPGIAVCAITWKTNVETKHILEYGTQTGVYTAATPLTSAEATDHAASLENLLPSTTYYYRVRSYYQTYQEADSAEYTFTTQALTSVTITAGPTLTIGQTSCDFTWTTNVATKHTIEYGTVSGSYSASTVLSAASTVSHSDSITGLTPATVYYYRIRSTYQNGLEGLSIEASFTTLARTALAVTVAPASTPSQTGCTLAWTTNLATTHIVEYGTVSGTYTAATVQTSAPLLANSEALTALSPATTYYYRIRSFATDGQTLVGAQASFTTLAGPPALAISSGPTASPVLTSASVSFTTNYATTSSIEYGTTSGNYTGNLTLDASATTHSRTISGLASGTTYYYVVHCYSAANGAVASAEMTFTTTAETGPTSAQRARGIWIVGGCSGSSWTTPVSQVDLYDPVTATWYPSVTTLGTPVSFAAVGTGTVSGHRVLVVAGGFDSTGTVRNIVQRYDIDAQTWLGNGTVMPAARANVVGATRNNCLYVVGGTTGNATAAWASATTDYEYNIGGDSWTAKVAIAAAGSERATAAFDDEVVYAGGRTTAAGAITFVDGILTIQNVLTTGYAESVLGTARSGHSLVTYTPSNGSTTLIVLGGFSGYTGTPTCYVFNAGTGGTLLNTAAYIRYPFFTPSAWQTCTNLPASVAFGSAVVYGNTLYYFGGTTSYTASGSGTVYTTDLTAGASATGAAANVWTTMGTAMPAVRYGHAAVRCN